jgi:hypothetical protein
MAWGVIYRPGDLPAHWCGVNPVWENLSGFGSKGNWFTEKNQIVTTNTYMTIFN